MYGEYMVLRAIIITAQALWITQGEQAITYHAGPVRIIYILMNAL
jgi:hypothetical protein